ncbi:MAG: hypoxanthine phosphoribosyltransferase [Alphaproteobacteria bacterium]|nr:hypoxanthine phosphoribosyltransferase [Alphaproteobacteria bacterium]
MKKRYLSANELLLASYQLAAEIVNDNFYPDFIVAVWRGGTPVGIAVQEFMEYCGINTDHIAIRTSYHIGIDERSKKAHVYNLGYLLDNVEAHHKLLIVDDVFDTGKSIEAILEILHQKARRNTPEKIKIATPYFKPNKNLTERQPDYFNEQLDTWLVFPHELCGLLHEEIQANKPGVADILATVKRP